MTIQRGLAVYKTDRSPYYFARLWDAKHKRYIVRSTKEKSRIDAERIAREFADSNLDKLGRTPPKRRFDYFASRLIDREERRVQQGSLSKNHAYMQEIILIGKIGICRLIGHVEISDVDSPTISKMFSELDKQRPKPLSDSTKNHYLLVLKKVLNLAVEERAVETLPPLPKLKRGRNVQKPRSSFKFHPIVSKSKDEYKKLLDTSKKLAKQNTTVRGIEITDELYDLILFVMHSFVRPSISELFAITHADVETRSNPKRLMITIAKGKTGFRYADTLEAAVSVYDRICKRDPEHEPTDHIFLPQYHNRNTAQRIITRQFNRVLEEAGLKTDRQTGDARTLYSLRHTAIQMRIVNSKGMVNIYNLARNAGTSVEMIERFYTRYLPNSDELAHNLQTFGT